MLRVLDWQLYLADWSPPQARVRGAQARQAWAECSRPWASVFSQQPLCRRSGRLLSCRPWLGFVITNKDVERALAAPPAT